MEVDNRRNILSENINFTPGKPNRLRAKHFNTTTPLAPILNKPKRQLSPNLKQLSYEERFEILSSTQEEDHDMSSKVLLTPCNRESNSRSRRRSRSCKYSFVSATGTKPHPFKETEGEDASFTAKDMLAIADGVGGWTELGIDSGIYSRELLQLCKEISEKEELLPEYVMLEAFEKAMSKGSATCTLVALGDDCKLRAANLGDSGFLLFRRMIKNPIDEFDKENTPPEYEWRAVFKSNIQEHYFNCPRQIGTDTKDRPEDCDRYAVAFVPGDLVLLATDGLFDNLSLKEISVLINEVQNEDSQMYRARPSKYLRHDSSFSTKQDDTEDFLNAVAKHLTQEAFLASIDQTRKTPFQIGARKNNMEYSGGKMDDITIIVSKIVEKKIFEPDAEQEPKIPGFLDFNLLE